MSAVATTPTDRYARAGEKAWETDSAKRLIKVCEQISRKEGWRPYESFRRAVEIGEAALTARGEPGPHEDRYLAYVKLMKPETVQLCCQFLGEVYLGAWPHKMRPSELAVGPDFRDHLGSAYMAITGSDKFNGEFFTPWPVARFMARVIVGDAQEALERTPQNPLTVYDPACGSGVMFLAAASELPWRAIQEGRVAFYGQDIDPVCANMARINLMVRGMTGPWPEGLMVLAGAAGRFGQDAGAVEAARALAPHGKRPPEQIAREAARDYAEVARTLVRLDGATVDPASAPPAPRVAKVPRNRRG